MKNESQSLFFQEKTLYKKIIYFLLNDLNNYESMSIKALHKLFEL
jgi:hypothetical protein